LNENFPQLHAAQAPFVLFLRDKAIVPSITGSQWGRMVLEQFDELFVAEPGLIQDGGQGPALEVFVAVGHGDPQAGPLRVFEDVVAARDVVNKKPAR